jgi:hypothetical protein
MFSGTRHGVRRAAYLLTVIGVLVIGLVIGAGFSLAAFLAVICGLIAGEVAAGRWDTRHR